jgi:hypothetical protein
LNYNNGNVDVFYVVLASVPRSHLEDNWGNPISWQLSVGSQPVKRRLGGWREISASLGVSQLSVESCSAREAVKIETEGVKLKILRC